MKRNDKENPVEANVTGQSNTGAGRTANQAFCLICRKKVELMSYERTAETLQINFNELLEFAEAGQLHRLHNARGKIAICAESVFEFLEKRPTQRFNPDIFKTNPSSSRLILNELGK